MSMDLEMLIRYSKKEYDSMVPALLLISLSLIVLSCSDYVNALSQSALNDIIREADRINEGMKEKIANGPGSQNFGG